MKTIEPLLWAFSLGLLFLSSVALSKPFSNGLETDLTIKTADGLERTFDLFIPKSRPDASAKYSVVFDIHGFASNRFQQRSISGMKALAKEKGFIVIWPQGVRNTWNAPTYGPLEPTNYAQQNAIDDVGFIVSLIHWLGNNIDIDYQRIYATGLSNGGGMTHRLGLEVPHYFAAIAPISYPFTDDMKQFSGYPPTQMPILQVHGKNDKLVRYPCSSIPGLGCIEDGFNEWAAINGCTTPSVVEQSRYKFRTPYMKQIHYLDCNNNKHTELLILQAGHLPYFNANRVDVADRIWTFFNQQVREY